MTFRTPDSGASRAASREVDELDHARLGQGVFDRGIDHGNESVRAVNLDLDVPVARPEVALVERPDRASRAHPLPDRPTPSMHAGGARDARSEADPTASGIDHCAQRPRRAKPA
jgi:hypothetical protein